MLYKGPLYETVFQLMGGLRAVWAIADAARIDELQQNGQFIRITGAGLRETHPHDISITKEAPNYSVPGQRLNRIPKAGEFLAPRLFFARMFGVV